MDHSGADLGQSSREAVAVDRVGQVWTYPGYTLVVLLSSARHFKMVWHKVLILESDLPYLKAGQVTEHSEHDLEPWDARRHAKRLA